MDTVKGTSIGSLRNDDRSAREPSPPTSRVQVAVRRVPRAVVLAVLVSLAACAPCAPDPAPPPLPPTMDAAPAGGAAPAGVPPASVAEPEHDGRTLSECLDELGRKDGDYWGTVEALLAMGAPARDRVIAMLASVPEGDPRVEALVAAVRGLTCDGDALEPVLDLASTGDAIARARVLRILANSAWHSQGRDELVLAHLVPLLSAEDPETRKLVLEALRRVDHLGDAERVVMALAVDPDPAVRAAVLGIRNREAAGWGELDARGFDDPSPEVRAAACESRRLAGNSPEMRERLVSALRDVDEEVRSAAAYALADSHPDPEAVAAALVAAVGDDSPEVRRRALFALVKLKQGSRVPLDRLIDLLREPGPCRWPALEAAAQHGAAGSGAKPAILALLEDPDRSVREDAVAALLAVVPGDPEALAGIAGRVSDPDRSVREAALDALPAWGAGAAGPLVHALADPEKSLREKAVEALGKVGAPATDALVRALSDADPRRRSGALRALTGIAPETAADRAAALLSDSDPAVRAEAAATIRKAPPGAAKPVEVLVRLLSDPESSVRAAAAAALGTGGSVPAAALARLRSALEDEDRFVRLAAASALLPSDPATAIPVLAALLGEEGVPYGALVALATVADSEPAAFDAVVSALRAPWDCIRQAAVEILGSLGSRAAAAVPDLVKTLAGEIPAGTPCPEGQCDPRYAAIEALREIAPDDPRVTAALEVAAKSEDRWLREAALEALGREKTDDEDRHPTDGR